MTPNQAILVLAQALVADVWTDALRLDRYFVKGLPVETFERVKDMADALASWPSDDELQEARDTLADYAEPAADVVLVRRQALRDVLAHLDAQEETTGTAPCQAPFTTVVRRALDD